MARPKHWLHLAATLSREKDLTLRRIQSTATLDSLDSIKRFVKRHTAQQTAPQLHVCHVCLLNEGTRYNVPDLSHIALEGSKCVSDVSESVRVSKMKLGQRPIS